MWAAKLTEALRFIAHADLYSFDIKHLVNGFPWASIDTLGSTIVDVGGGHGTVSRELHDHTTHTKFIVQDLPGTVSEGESALPEQYKSRISFMEHDFFNPQPIAGPRSTSSAGFYTTGPILTRSKSSATKQLS